MFSSSPSLVKAALIFSVLASPAIASSYTFRSVDLAGTNPTALTGINRLGHIVGFNSRCFVLSGSKQTPVDNGNPDSCFGINASGSVVGTYFLTHTAFGFVYAGGVFTSINPPESDGNSWAYGISDTGVITGGYYPRTGPVYELGFVYDGKTYSTINLPNSRQVVVTGVNNAGQLVIFQNDTSYHPHSFLKTGSKLLEISYPGAAGTYTGGINDTGQVALCWSTAQGISHGAVYDSAKNTYYDIDYPGTSSGTCVMGISDKQTLVGTYHPRPNSQAQGFVATGHLAKVPSRH